MNNSIYLIKGAISFILWNKNSKSNKITEASLKEKIIYILIIAIVTALVGIILKGTDDTLPTLDVFTTVSSLIATITEILYAGTHNKKTVVFCNTNMTNYKVEGEYWFLILTAKEQNKIYRKRR